MREICQSGSEGGVAQTNAPSLPPIKGGWLGRKVGPWGLGGPGACAAAFVMRTETSWRL